MQKKVFLQSEGDQWFRRNLSAITAENDPVLRVLETLKPRRIFEVGCANGWRLAEANRRFGAECSGIDPSAEAVVDGRARHQNIKLQIGTADKLPLADASVDCVVFGWCLYLCDRSDLFRIAAEADRVVAPSGYIVVYDFYTRNAYANPYHHRDGLFSYKMDYSTLWSWHPSYVLWHHEVLPFHDKNPDEEDNRLAISILKKMS